MFKGTDIKPFENKVWLASPTMHGEELQYMTEAYETNWMSTVGENINEVERITCEKVGAIIIEDAAESLGATYKGVQTGSFGAYNCISFNGNNLSAA